MVTHSIILFDGVCNLCNGAVQFVIKRDKKNQFLFASLQSVEGRKILTENNLSSDKLYSIILVEDGKIYDRSTAALRVVKKLGGFWQFFYGFIIVPEFIRNGVYNFIAKNRYRWFGRKDECMIPTPELKSKFLNN
ncbi:MAG: thiol-disulfide oxidoreductase DCC family protein [Bacteroidota bacterium]|nr:thiol-disulfide oxidoreductase DCC family protein [Bacteroidota bacterium]